jgi:Tfp pilus assembly protein PilN
MINLLPPELTTTMRYGRRNARLRFWLLGLIAAVIGLVAIVATGSFYLSRQAKDYEKNIASTNQQLKDQNLTKVQKDAAEISGDIRVINQVLNQELSFSSLLQSIGTIMPPQTVLTSLSLSSNVSGSVDLNAATVNPPAAAQIAINLSDPNRDLFSKVDVVTINCSNIKVDTPYKCSATLRALFSKSAKTKFLSLPKDNTP